MATKSKPRSENKPFNWLEITAWTFTFVFLILMLIMSAKPELLGGQQYNNPYGSFGSDIFTLFPIFFSLPIYWQIIIVSLFTSLGFLWVVFLKAKKETIKWLYQIRLASKPTKPV